MNKKEVLDKMRKIESDVPVGPTDVVSAYSTDQWEARWIKLKCWLKMYGE